MPTYNYEGFSPGDYAFSRVDGPKAGGKAPDFDLQTETGERKRILDFGGDFLVLEMGSITCPLFQSRRKAMMTLTREFPNISNAVLYVREAHPGASITEHRSFGDKASCATRLRSVDGETRTIFVDDFEGAAHQAYGSMPNTVFIINRNGCVVFRSEWNNAPATRKAIKALTAGGAVSVKSYFRPARPTIALRTLRNAGPGAASDFFRGLPKLIWENVIKRNLKILLGREEKLSAHTTC